jgi:predicted dithiol-disulfide oxidoreductase (DUF899 family)
MSMQFPNESSAYRVARNTLLDKELALRRATEAVAVARRALPPGGQVPEDYVFTGRIAKDSTGSICLSELFAPGLDTLVVYSFMFPRSRSDDRPGPAVGETAALTLQDGPCPSCTALLDQLDGAARHLNHLINFVVVAKTSASRLLTFADERGWRYLRLLSSASNNYNRDYHGETQEAAQQPMLNVFRRSGDGIRHFWGSELLDEPTDPGQDMRHTGTLEPMWNMLDLTPEGRGTLEEQLSYACCRG